MSVPKAVQTLCKDPCGAASRDWDELHSINACVLPFMEDVKQWMEKAAFNSLSGHSQQHQFKLVLGNDGKAELFYKKWSTTPSWLPKGKGLTLLDSLPSGVPKLLKPDPTNMCLDKLKTDLPKYALHYDKESQQWWEEFIALKYMAATKVYNPDVNEE